MYISTMATDDVLTPCVSRSSAAAILTLYERSVLVFFEIVKYIFQIIHISQQQSPVQEMKLLVNLLRKLLCLVNSQGVNIFLS